MEKMHPPTEEGNRMQFLFYWTTLKNSEMPGKRKKVERKKRTPKTI